MREHLHTMFVSSVFLHLRFYVRIYICIRNFIQLPLKIMLHILNAKCMIRKNKFMRSPKNLLFDRY